jgi:hypothetical protein
MVRCNITTMAVWLYGAVQHDYAGARVARFNPSLSVDIPITRLPIISHCENRIGTILRGFIATQPIF